VPQCVRALSVLSLHVEAAHHPVHELRNPVPAHWEYFQGTLCNVRNGASHKMYRHSGLNSSELRIRIWIWNGFNRFTGSRYEYRKAKWPHQNIFMSEACFGFVSFWASWIRIQILPSSSKKVSKTLISTVL
jgi:hypothetical protein